MTLAITEPDASYYDSAAHFAVLQAVNTPLSPVSLRAVEWTCNNSVKLASAGIPQDVHAYQHLVKSLGRKSFDPFRRNDRIPCRTPSGTVMTTAAQMNFFKWFIECGGWAWVIRNKMHVQAMMTRSCRQKDRHCSRDNDQVECTQFMRRHEPKLIMFD